MGCQVRSLVTVFVIAYQYLLVHLKWGCVRERRDRGCVCAWWKAGQNVRVDLSASRNGDSKLKELVLWRVQGQYIAKTFVTFEAH